jgi:fatty acid desaturase
MTTDFLRKNRLAWEAPTIAVSAAIYGGFLALTWHFQDIPVIVSAPLGALILAWHNSLQHETIHGHPTRSRRINAILGGIPLSLWLPYPVYRESHLRHHGRNGQILTDPDHDPESYYLRRGALAGAHRVAHWIAQANRTLAGRLILGPALSIGRCWGHEARRIAEPERAAIWAWHAAAAGLVLIWTLGVCRIPIAVYLGLIVYPGVALGQLRSFVEHRAHRDPAQRTAVVEANPFWGMLFLNNNLHVVHHEQPGLPWYDIPKAWRKRRPAFVASHGPLFEGGYWGIVQSYALRPAIEAEHPAFAGQA